jgi:hypothetical protein
MKRVLPHAILNALLVGLGVVIFDVAVHGSDGYSLMARGALGVIVFVILSYLLWQAFRK